MIIKRICKIIYWILILSFRKFDIFRISILTATKVALVLTKEQRK